MSLSGGPGFWRGLILYGSRSRASFTSCSSLGSTTTWRGHKATPLSAATEFEHSETVEVLAAAAARCDALQIAAHDGNRAEVWRLVDAHANMVHAGSDAADVAEAQGHVSLAGQMRDLWTRVVAHRGYAKYAAHLQSQRARWLILRNRFQKRLGRYLFGRAVMPQRVRHAFDWMFVGTSGEICPDDPLSVIMSYWGE